MFEYPVTLQDDDGTVLVTFPDVPIATSFGDDETDALARAGEALETAFIALMDDRADIPRPSKPKRGQHTVSLSPSAAAKVALYQAMRDAGVRKAELARRLGVHMPQVDRLLDLRHASRLEQIDAALRALGKQLVVSVQDAA